jgi:hypothetical protein
MPICITGMHRSGTSLVARMLNLCGLNLGPADQFIPAADDNPEGFWELRPFVEFNERLLGLLGRDWHRLEPLPPGWESRTEIQSLLTPATDLVASLKLVEPWGWKDPRTALTFPFWNQLWPDVRAVICVRHPLEVALSLLKRDGFPCQKSLSAWLLHYHALLDNIPPERRIVTHYESCLQDAETELGRMVKCLGLAADEERIRHARAAVRPPLRHTCYSPKDLILVNAPSEVTDCYQALCAEAEYVPAHGNQPGADQTERVAAFSLLVKRYEESAAAQYERVSSLARDLALCQQRLAAQMYLNELAGLLPGSISDHPEANGQSGELPPAQVAQIGVLTEALAAARHDRCLLQQRVDELSAKKDHVAGELAETREHLEEVGSLLARTQQELEAWQQRLAARRHRYADRVTRLLLKLKPLSS